MLAYGSYTFDSFGMRERFLKKRIYRWDSLVAVMTTGHRGQYSKYYETTLLFAERTQCIIRVHQWFSSFSKLASYANVLILVQESAGTSAEFCELSQLIIKWGRCRKEYEQEHASPQAFQETEHLMNLGEIAFLQFEYRKAKRFFRQCLERNPNDPDALQFLATIARLSMRLIDMKEHYDRLFAFHPSTSRYLAHAAMAYVQLAYVHEHDEEFAKQYLQKCPQHVLVTVHLCQYFFRKKRYTEMLQQFEHLHDATIHPHIKEFATGWIDYLHRYQTDGWFRRKEQVSHLLAYRRLIGFLGFSLLMIAQYFLAK